MGLETTCRVEWEGEATLGQVHLDDKQLRVRGDLKLAIPLAKILSCEGKQGVLHVRLDDGTALFYLGPEAEKWALKIRYPRTLIDKLGVKPDSRVSVLSVTDSDFWRHLRSRTSEISEGLPAPGSDFVFLMARQETDLEVLLDLQDSIQSNGSIWVVWPKGQRAFNENHVRRAARASGLVDVKVVSFSDTLSALKLMIPRSRR